MLRDRISSLNGNEGRADRPSRISGNFTDMKRIAFGSCSNYFRPLG